MARESGRKWLEWSTHGWMVLVGVAVRAPLKTTSANNKFCLPKKLASPDGETEPKNGFGGC